MPELLERDPQNRLLARGARFRLSAEQIRDQALEVAGLRSERMFGPGVMPPQPEGIWRSPYSGMKWQTSEAENRYRRGIYTYWKRTTPYPSMVSFDSPSRELCVSRRIRTNTPLQALVSLNDPVFVEAARSLAARMSRAEESRPGDSLRVGFQLALLRRPAEEELASLRDFFRGSRDYYEAHPEEARRLAGEDVSSPSAMAALTATANVILNLDEFVTRN
jgi:hypothetical protein